MFLKCNMNIKYVLFDWDGTLGIEGTRWDFINAKTKAEKLQYLQIHVYEVLQSLNNSGEIKMGILSNTHIDGNLIRESMDIADLSHFFTVQVYTSDKGVPGEKPDKATFDYAFSKIKLQHPEIKKENVLYVGNSYVHDVMGSWNAGMYSAYIVNESLIKYYVSMTLPLPTFVLYNMKDLIGDVILLTT